SHVPSSVKLPDVRVLVVDDDACGTEIIRRLLKDSDAIVETAGSGSEALARISAKRPDLFLSDIGMPEMDGIELIRHVRARYADLPAIAVTAFARPEDRTRALQAGFNMQLSKPIDAQELLSAMASLLRVPTQV